MMMKTIAAKRYKVLGSVRENFDLAVVQYILYLEGGVTSMSGCLGVGSILCPVPMGAIRIPIYLIPVRHCG